MSCECDNTACCCGLLSASDTASASVRELYRRPTRRRYLRHVSRRRLLHQHTSCPNNFIRSDELTTTSADELSAWTWRRTRSDLPPLAATRYKTDRSRHSMRLPRSCTQTAARRGAARHRRTTTIVHHPCCLTDPTLCPVMKGSHHRQRMRPEDIDSDTLRNAEAIRAHLESHLYQQPRRKPQTAPWKAEPTTQIPGTMPQHQSKPMKSAQQNDPHEKKCKLCGNPQHYMEPTAQYAQSYQRQPPAPAAGHPFAADVLTPEVSSETADRLVDELSRRSAGPRAALAPHRVNLGDAATQQRNPTSAATTNVFPASPASGLRKGDAAMKTSCKLADIALNSPLADIREGRTTIQNMPHPRSTPNNPFLDEYYSRRYSHVLEHGNETRPPAQIKTGPPMTQFDVDTSYTMHSIASARAAATKNPDSENPQRHATDGAFSYEKDASQPENATINFQQTTRRSVSECAKPSVDEVFLPSPPKGVLTFGGQNDSRNQVGRVEPELRIMPQSDPDSARYTAGTYVTDISELQQTGNHSVAAESSSSNGDFQSGNQTPVENGGGGNLRHMDGVEKVLKGTWPASGSDKAQVNSLNSRTDKLSSPVPSFGRALAAGDMGHLPGRQRASSQASPSSRKSVTSSATHRGDGNHRETDVRKSGNSNPNNLNVDASDDTAVKSRHNCMESLSKPEVTGCTSFRIDGCGSSTCRSSAEQGDKQQEATRSASRGGTPTAEGGCKPTPNAEDKALTSSRVSSRSGSTAASTKTTRRRPKDRGDGDAKGASSENNGVAHLLGVDGHIAVMEHVAFTRKKIMDYIDNVLAVIINSPVMDHSESGSQAKLQSADQFMARSRSVMGEHGDSSDPECPSMGLSSELWNHVNVTVRDTLANLPQQRASKGALSSSGEGHNNRKLLKKLQKDLIKNIVTNLSRLEDIESVLYPNNGEGPCKPPSK